MHTTLPFLKMNSLSKIIRIFVKNHRLIWTRNLFIYLLVPYDKFKGLHTLLLVKKIEKIFIAFSESTYPRESFPKKL